MPGIPTVPASPGKPSPGNPRTPFGPGIPGKPENAKTKIILQIFVACGSFIYFLTSACDRQLIAIFENQPLIRWDRKTGMF